MYQVSWNLVPRVVACISGEGSGIISILCCEAILYNNSILCILFVLHNIVDKAYGALYAFLFSTKKLSLVFYTRVSKHKMLLLACA